MYIIVVGCGRLGSTLAQKLSAHKYDVTVIDSSADAFSRLTNSFDGVEVVGNPIDGDVLKAAGIEHADALVAVTADDNVNVTVSQIAGTIYNVPIVLARISDPEREGFYRHLGLTTVCPTNTGIDQIFAIIMGENLGLSQAVTRDPSILPVLAEKAWIGKPSRIIDLPHGVKLGGIVRHGRVLTDTRETIVHGDAVLLLMQ